MHLRIFQEELSLLLSFSIRFSSEFHTYLFNDKWLMEYSDDFFIDKIYDLKNLLEKHLHAGQNNLNFLEGLLEQLDDHVEWLKEKRSNNIQLFDSIKIISAIHLSDPPDKILTVEEIMKIDDENDVNYELSRYVRRHAKESENFSNHLDLEKIKLLYTLRLRTTALEDFSNLIHHLVENYKYINFSQISLLEEFNSQHVFIDTNKCKSTLSKYELAQFFYTLMDENILFFDSNDEDNNRLLMQKFIISNFSYKGDQDKQTDITKVSREFSEAKHFTYKEKQLKFLNKIISILEKRRNKLQG